MNTEIPPKHEPVSIPVRVPGFFALGLAALVLLTLVGLSWLDRLWSGPVETRQPALPPALVQHRAGVEAPLSADQRRQRERYDTEQDALLTTYGWIDQPGGVARIPIARAMELYEQQQGPEK